MSEPPSLHLLTLELKPVVEWELLCVHLHLGDLYDRISSNYRHLGIERCKLELFNLWLKKNKSITWERVAFALDCMEEVTLASHLREKYSTVLHVNGQLTSSKIVSIKEKPQKKFAYIQRKFAHLLVQVKMSLKTNVNLIDLDCFYEYLRVLVPAIQKSEPLQVESLFLQVQKHCDFLHHSLIEHIVKYEPLKGSTNFIQIKKKYKRYEKELKNFKESTEMRHLITDIQNCLEIDGMVPVKVKFEAFLEKIRITKFIDLLKEIFYCHTNSLVKIEVTEGCLCIHWLVPALIGYDMIAKLSKSREVHHFMKTVGILFLQIDATIILERGMNLGTKYILDAFHRTIRSQNVAACEFLLNAFHDEILKRYRLSQNLPKLLQDSVSLIEISCSRGHSQVVKTLLCLGFYKERPRSTPLMIACAEGHLAVVNILLESATTVDINKQGPDGETALHLSCSKKYTAVVKCLLQYICQNHVNIIDIADNNEMTPLMISAGSGQRTIVRELLLSGANPNVAKKDGDTALHIACWNGNCGVVRELLKQGADSCARKVDSWTPLMVAIPSNRIKVVELLLKIGNVDPNMQSEMDGDNALLIASWNNCHDIVKLLLLNNANPNITKYDGWTPLIAAGLLGFEDIVCTLIDHGASVNTQANDGVTSLYVACQEGHSKVVSLLIDNDADIHLWKTEIESGSKYTPFAIACQNGHVNVIELLLKKDPTQLEARNESGATPLFIASYNNQAAAVKFLLDKNANPFSLDNEGRSALDVTQNNVCRSLLHKAGPVVKQAFPQKVVTNAKLTAHQVGRQFVKIYQSLRQRTRTKNI